MVSQWAEEVGNIWALSKRRSSPQTLLAVPAVDGNAACVVQGFGKSSCLHRLEVQGSAWAERGFAVSAINS